MDVLRAFVIWETLEMVEWILLLQLESEIDNEILRAFAISDIQSFPTGDERLSVCQLCQKQHGLWKWDQALVGWWWIKVWRAQDAGD